MQQTQINFERSEQLGLIRGADLPAAGNIRPDKLKAVLRVIDDHAGQYGWCFVSQATIAREACMPLRTVQRAIVVLRDHLGVILTVRKQSDGGTVINHARIVWTELALLCEPHRARRAAQDQTAKSEDQTAKSEDQTAKTEDQTANTGGFNRKRPRSAQEAPPPPTPSSSWAAAAEALESVDLRMRSRAILDAQERGYTPADVLAWVDEFRRHRTRFRGPEAILWRIREGCWPVELPDAEAVERVRLAAVERDADRAYGGLFLHIVKSGRRARIPDEEIKQRLRSQIPEEYLASQGW